MFRFFSKALSDERIEAIEKSALEAAEAGDIDKAREELKPLMRAQRHQADAARSLVRLASGIERPPKWSPLKSRGSNFDTFVATPLKVIVLGHAAISGGERTLSLDPGDRDRD